MKRMFLVAIFSAMALATAEQQKPGVDETPVATQKDMKRVEKRLSAIAKAISEAEKRHEAALAARATEQARNEKAAQAQRKIDEDNARRQAVEEKMMGKKIIDALGGVLLVIGIGGMILVLRVRGVFTKKEIIDEPATPILPLLREMAATKGKLRIEGIKLVSWGKNPGDRDLPVYYYTAIFDPVLPIANQKPSVRFDGDREIFLVGWDNRRSVAAKKAASQTT